MKQVVEELKTGAVRVWETPVPRCGSREVLVRTGASLISAGTEKLMIEMGKKSLVGKARARPDLLRTAIDKAKKEGFVHVFKEAMSRLDTPMPLGYSCAGAVVEVGADVRGFKTGDRVACTGAGLANHAEFNLLPAEQCVLLDQAVSDEEAAFVMLGGIALHGIRSANLTFGESVAVVGLGLIGLLTVQIARAYGCRVVGIDIDPAKVQLARRLGCDLAVVLGKKDPVVAVVNFTNGIGADAVLITAATKDNAPVQLSEQIARRRGRIVLVGVSDLHLTRKPFWDKELSFTVSRASGPSRESHGTGLLPPDLIRWSDPRNHEEFIRLIARGSVNVRDLITHRFPLERAETAYEMIMKGNEPYIGVVLQYPSETTPTATPPRRRPATVAPADPATRSCVGFIGAGLFTRNFLAPAVRQLGGVKPGGVAARTGLSARHLAQKHGMPLATAEYREILENPTIGSVIIATRHDLHGKLVVESLNAGKHVFVEKPLCIDAGQLEAIAAEKRKSVSRVLQVGFNRRYSPLAVNFRKALEGRESPLQMIYRVNAGFVPPESWVQHPTEGAGRIIGEVCHFIDFLQFLSGAFPVEVAARSISGPTGKYQRDDNVSIEMTLSDGSLGTIIYTALGSKAFSRERVEAFWDESAAVLDDFRSLELFIQGRREKDRLMNQDLGYRGELKHFFSVSPENGQGMFREALATTAATFAAVESLRNGRPVTVRSPEVRE